MKRVNVRINDELDQWYKAKSKARGITTSSLMNEALNFYKENDSEFVSKVDKNKFEMREKLRIDTRIDFNHFLGLGKVFEKDTFYIGALDAYIQRRNAGQSEEEAHKTIHRYVEARFFQIMNLLLAKEHILSDVLQEAFEHGGENDRDYKQILIVKNADSREKLSLITEIQDLYKFSKFEPSMTWELLYQESTLNMSTTLDEEEEEYDDMNSKTGNAEKQATRGRAESNRTNVKPRTSRRAGIRSI